MKRNLTLFCAAALFAVASACASGTGGAGTHKQAITPAGAASLAPYSTAVRTGDLIFFSGVVGTAPGSRVLIEGGIREETGQALENLTRAMAAAGVRAADLVKCTVFLADIRDYAAMNEVYGAFFEGTDPPARSAIGVSGLPIGARVEIECIAAARD